MEGITQLDANAPARDDVFTATVGEHYSGLVRRLTAVLDDREAALDVAQEAYLRAYRAWDRFDGTDARAWLHTIGLRLAFNERARRRRWSGLLLSGRPMTGATSLVPADPDLHRALASLRREHRAALLMSVVDGYTQAEIAAILDVAPGTVASWLSRAKSAMREAITNA
jgi:RNA polymerase sigma-70 factor (ECF subfamily)